MLPLLLLLAFSCEASLVARGPWIYDSRTNARVRLRCLNWYGAHQELFVVGGLEAQSVGYLVSLLASSGANCVRLPFSVEMVRSNPVVKRDAVAGIQPHECNSTERALEVMDCVVEHLRGKGLLLIFNCHNSWAGWVGTREESEQQGLWNLPGYSTEDWVRSLEAVARRYPMAGMDLRNEIHDQWGTSIVWGESTDVNVDWLAASTLASGRLHAVDPELLIIVGGLCWNLDLRDMALKIGPLSAYYRGKLVYTVHVYHWSFWWRMEPAIFEGVQVACGFVALLSFALALMCSLNYMNRFKECTKICNPYKRFDGREQPSFHWTTLSMVVASSIVFHVGWLGVALLFERVASDGGCSTLARDARWLIHTEAVLVSLCGLLLCVHVYRYSDTALASMMFVWLGIFAMTVLYVMLYLESERAVTDFLGIWELRDRIVPVWVGEFGIPANEASNRVWQVIWRYMARDHDLDFAFWAFNGRKWHKGRWENETFGMADYNYTGFRDPSFVRDIFH